MKISSAEPCNAMDQSTDDGTKFDSSMESFQRFPSFDVDFKVAKSCDYNSQPDCNDGQHCAPQCQETFVVYRHKERLLSIKSGTNEPQKLHLDKINDICQLNACTVAVQCDDLENAAVLQFLTTKDAKTFIDLIKAAKSKTSVFDRRTEESSATQYFQFYGYLSQQQNMLQDFVRTYTYQKAVLSNIDDFKDKVVLDVGAGSGILSFFAVQAGAKKVYAVEASNMAQCCETLVRHNGMQDKITVLAGKIEEIEVPELVDTIISEPMGYMLLNERMLETFLHAKKFLRPGGGKMYPTKGDLHIAPFTDEALYIEQCSKANFWCQNSFHGVNLTALAGQAMREYFQQPVVDTFHPVSLVARSVVWSLDFSEKLESELHTIDIPLEFTLQQNAYIHGLAFWFDVAFLGSNLDVWLSTAPSEPLTHWYQVRCLLETPLLGFKGDQATGHVRLVANKRQSYDVQLELMCNGCKSGNSLDLKNPCFRYTGQPAQPPPGQHAGSPTENYWANQQQQPADVVPAATQQMNFENGCVDSAPRCHMDQASTLSNLYVAPKWHERRHGGNNITVVPPSVPGAGASPQVGDVPFSMHPSYFLSNSYGPGPGTGPGPVAQPVFLSDHSTMASTADQHSYAIN